MRQPIAFALALIVCALLGLTGCTGKDHRTATVTLFEANHPHADLIQRTPQPDGTEVRVYTDHFPRMPADGGATEYELQTFVVTARGDTVVDFASGVQLP